MFPCDLNNKVFRLYKAVDISQKELIYIDPDKILLNHDY